MKYDEMIQEIIKILEDTNDNVQELRAQRILEMQKQFGMLPPEYKKKMTRDLGDGLVVSFNKNVREWEEVKPL